MSRQHRLRFARRRDATVAMMVLVTVWASSMPYAKAQANTTWTGAANATWNTSSANWSGGSTLWTAGANAVFDASGANRAITVSGSQSVANLTVSATGYSFTSGTLGIAPNATWTIASDAPMSTAIGGTNGFNKSGAGTLTLSGSNAFTGETRVSAGTLTLNNVNALRFSTLNFATGDSGTVSFGLSGANTYFIGGLAGGSGRTLDSGTNVLSFGAGNANTSFSGNITAAGLVFNGTGSFLFNTGTINLFTSSTSSAPSAFSVQRNATINSDVTITLPSTSGAGTLLPATSSGTLTLGGNVKFVAAAGGNPGVNLLAPLVLSNATVTGSTGNFRVQSLFTVSSGTFEWGGPTASTALQAASTEGFNVIDGATVRGSTVAVGGGRNGLLTVGNGNGTSTLLARNDAGAFQSITLSSGSGQSATLVLNAGGLIDATAITVSQTASIPTVIFNGGTFRARGNQSTELFNVTNNQTNPNGTLRVESGGATINTNGFSVTQTTPFVSGSTSGGGLTKLGSGTLTLNGTNTYTGATTISAGMLALGSLGSIASSGTVTVGDTGSTGVVLDLTAKSSPFAFTSGQKVGGIGTINIGAGKTLSIAGIWAPGNSIGSNTVTGNLTLSGTSQFELGTPGTSTSAPGTSDFTAVSGTLTLGGNLDLLDNAGANGNGSAAGGVYRLFTYGNEVSGNFASVTQNPTPTTRTSLGNISYGGSGTAAGRGVFLSIYNLASATSSQTVNLGNVHVGDTATKAVTITNTAPVNGTYTETLGSGGFSSTSAGFTATGSVTGIAGGSSGTGSLLVGFTSGSAGARNGTTVLALNSEAVNSSGLGTTGAGTQTITITGTVWNYAAASVASGTAINFGTVLKNTPLSQSLSITNSAPTGFTEKLDAVFGSPSAGVSGSGSFTLLSAGGTSTAMSVYLASGSAGAASGSIQVDFTSNGDGTSGLGTTSLTSQTVSMLGTVLDPAVASFASGSTTTSLLLDFGSVQQNASASPLNFDLWNLVQTSGYTANLALLNVLSGTGNTGAISTTLPSSFNNLAAGDSFSYSASLATNTAGFFTNVYTLEFKSANNGSVFTGDTPQTLTLTVQGVIVVPEPRALALAAIGIGLAGWSLWKRRCAS